MKKFIKNKNFFVAGFLRLIPALVYGVLYLLWFFHLENTVTKHYTVIHMNIDDYIPFVEIFVVPYYLWFFYVVATVVFLCFQDKEDYFRCCAYLFTGMTVFLIVSTLFPNGHHLRPLVMPRNNIFTELISKLYATDTATNLWPSIHCFNSIGVFIAIKKSKFFEHNRKVQIGSFLLSLSIILSTVFIKQHSMFDVLTAFLMAIILYVPVYHYDILYSKPISKEKSKPQVE